MNCGRSSSRSPTSSTEQYRQVLAPKFVKGSDGEEYDERQKLRDDFYEALTAFGLLHRPHFITQLL